MCSAAIASVGHNLAVSRSILIDRRLNVAICCLCWKNTTRMSLRSSGLHAAQQRNDARCPISRPRADAGQFTSVPPRSYDLAASTVTLGDEAAMLTVVRLTVLIASLLLLPALPVQAARTCSQVHNGCVSKCMTLGIGRARKIGIAQPMPADVCRAHCIGWTTECKKTGCFNGDLHQECGLFRR